MLSISDATKIVEKALPDGKIQKHIEYKEFYIFQVFSDLPEEEDWDPFFSVNKETGEFRDFSIITDGNISEITNLFTKTKSVKPVRR